MVNRYPVPPDALLAAISILETAFPTVLVSPQMPTTRPAQFIRVSQIGGHQPNVVTDAPRLLIEFWAANRMTASAMARVGGAALRNAAGTVVEGAFIRSWSNESGPVDYPDPDVSDMSRYQVFGDLQVSMNEVVTP